MVRTTGEVVSVSERQGVATVLLDKGGESYSDRVQEIPLARLEVANAQVYLRSLRPSKQFKFLASRDLNSYRFDSFVIFTAQLLFKVIKSLTLFLICMLFLTKKFLSVTRLCILPSCPWNNKLSLLCLLF